MRSFLGGILAASSLVSTLVLTVPAQTAPLRLVSTAWAPFTNDIGQPRLALDLVESAFERIKVESRTFILDPSRFTPALLSGDFDGSGAAWKDPEREQALLFSQAYLENRLILVGRRGSVVSAETLAALKGKRVSIVEGYAYGAELDASGATLVRSHSEEDSLAQLLSAKSDYALIDDLVVQYIVNNYPNEAKARLSLGANPLLIRPLYLAIRRARPDAESIVSRFNAQLRGMIADGTYHRLLRVTWIRADVDGDGIPELVPRSDKSGTAAPQNAYSLFSSATVQTPPSGVKPNSRFYVGGDIYSNWASIPNRYKVEDPQRPDPARSTASLFKFSW